MTSKTNDLDPHEAAEAFYGQNEEEFAAQLQTMGALDPRLIQAFERTRQRFSQQK